MIDPKLLAILESLKASEDFGVVHRKGCEEKFKQEHKKPYFKGPGRCPVCEAKSDLWLPGAEQITRGMDCQFGEPMIAQDVMDAAKDIDYVWVAFRVPIIDSQTGECIGYGVGARSLIDSAGNANTMLKMAKKSAIIDAVKSTFALSSYFTQDVQDVETAGEVTATPKSAGPAPASPPPAPSAPVAPQPPSRPVAASDPAPAPTPPRPVAPTPPRPADQAQPAPPTPPRVPAAAVAPSAPAAPAPPMSVMVQRNAGVRADQAQDWPLPLMTFARYVGMFAISDPEAETILRLVGWDGGPVSTGYYAGAASLLHRGFNAVCQTQGYTAEDIKAWTLEDCHAKVYVPWAEAAGAVAQGPTA